MEYNVTYLLLHLWWERKNWYQILCLSLKDASVRVSYLNFCMEAIPPFERTAHIE